MYFITTIEKMETDPHYMAQLGATRCVGYYQHKYQAVLALHENRAGIDERLYNFAVLEYIPEGLYPQGMTGRQFFKWDEERDGFFEIDEPECVKRITNFAIG